MRGASTSYRLLGDEARLRLLRVLSVERLNVTELTAVLGLAQSGVSRHLKLLKDGGFVDERRTGGYSYYGLADLEGQGLGPLWATLQEQFAEEADDPAVKADEARLQEILRLRKESFTEHTAASPENRQLVPGRSWAAWSRALGLLLPPVRVADLGCGDGYLTIEASRWASHVVGVDRSAAVLDRARTLAEAARILVPGGRLLVLELREHEETWVRETLGDRILGFSEPRLRQLLCDAGLTGVRTTIGASKPGDPFTVLLAVGHKPGSSRPASAPAVPAHRGRES